MGLWVTSDQLEKITKVTKLADGGLQCFQASGNTFTISKDDPNFQAFAIYSIVIDA
jgi:hypothetical protein